MSGKTKIREVDVVVRIAEELARVLVMHIDEVNNNNLTTKQYGPETKEKLQR